MVDPSTSDNFTFPSTLLNNLSSLSWESTSAFYDVTNESTTTEFPEQIQTEMSTSVVNTSRITDIIENLTKAIDGATNSTQSSPIDSTTKGTICSTTEEPFDEFGPPEGVQYIFVPLGVMIFVVILSAVVLIISRKRKLERLRHRLMPLYNFDPGEEGEDDWETELLDENFDTRQKRQGYQSMDTEENAELFSSH
ncbi:uncharacterized protein C3orf18-like [Neodiprion fabricii]|uniref:uncharacterized protein C3orf18-like n=1 Tax=Neodiprion fabricii TaxID=2872261 RepID=UPI001ED91426|nr:uncharacterized protein C3orf18-like [Neodiprion fabricii]XP_046421950.1 uncharacterized protein C3orf18-like [Neodiprion fabricii]